MEPAGRPGVAPQQTGKIVKGLNMNDLGGWLWMVIDVGAVVLLGSALVYAVSSHRRRGREVAARRDEELRRGHDPRRFRL